MGGLRGDGRGVSAADRLASHGSVGDAVRKYLAAASLFQGDCLSDEGDEWWPHTRSLALAEVYDSAIRGVAALVLAGGRAPEARRAFRAALADDPALRTVERRVAEEMERLSQSPI